MASLQDTLRAAPLAPHRRIAHGRFAALAGLLMLSGCAAGDYPSLQRWPVMQAPTQPAGQIAAPTAPAPEHPHVGPGCDTAAADAIDADFRAALPGVERAVKDASGTPGTPAWSKGNIALASLQQIRARLGQVMAAAVTAYTADTIDHAQDDARDGPDQRADGAKLAACHAHVGQLVTDEDAQIDRLHALLPD